MIERQRAGKTMDRALRRRVRRDSALAGMSLHRRQIDDRSPAPLLHFWNSEMPQQIDAADVHHHAPVPGFEIGFNHGAKRMKGSRVHDDIEPAKFFASFGDRRPARHRPE